MGVERESVEFRLLGSLEAWRDGVLVQLGGAKQRALLARLLIDAPAVVSTDRLVDDLWGEDPPEQALHTVQVFVSRLRKQLGPEVLLTRAPGYLADVPAEAIDAQQFRALTSQAEQRLAAGDRAPSERLFEQAFELWRGPPLAEFAYEPWAREQAELLQELRLSALESWTEARLALSAHRELVGELEQLVVEQPLRERFRAQLMLALYRSGRQAEALEVYAQTRETLVEQLGIDPGAELQELYRQILNQDVSLAAPIEAPSVRAHNLPAPPNPLVGRERELDELGALLGQPDVRLVTLAGPGGTGKTRLGLELAHRLLGDFPDGVFWVSLAPIPSHELVLAGVARALDVREVPGEPLKLTVRSFLSTRRVLLLLDNFEHVLEARSLLATLLAACPALHLLVTSRAKLALSSEHIYEVQPLREDEAVELFVERAGQAGAEVAADETIAAICARLDRLPLAIELAAARAGLLEPAALLERLQRRLPLLRGGAADLPARQQTLYATIAWSHDLLDDEERALFRRLSVFAGSFTLESAEAVAEADLWTLESLVSNSLALDTAGPTAASLRAFSASRTGSGVRLHWRTASET